MIFKVGQRVRFLHESGDGVITRILDKETVEVDIGDDFEIEVGIDEIIAADPKEMRLPDENQTVKKRGIPKPQTVKRSSTMVDVSAAIVKAGDWYYELYLINPEPNHMVFTCYTRIKHKYEGIGSGEVLSNSSKKIAKLSADQMENTKEIYFQVLPFKMGRGLPHHMLAKAVECDWVMVEQDPVFISELDKPGWLFSIREKAKSQIEGALKEAKEIPIKSGDIELIKPTMVKDLHIEEIVHNPARLAPSEMLHLQLKEYRGAMREAYTNNHKSLILIHGVGDGTLKREIHKRLDEAEHVKKYNKADITRYGNGATEVFFFDEI